MELFAVIVLVGILLALLAGVAWSFAGRSAGQVFRRFAFLFIVGLVILGYFPAMRIRHSDQPAIVLAPEGTEVSVSERGDGEVTVSPQAKPVRPILDRLRPKRALLLAAVGGKGAAATKKIAPAPVASAGSPSSAAPARVDNPAEAPEPASSRPAWIDAQPDRVGDAFQMAVSVGPFPTLVQCDKELPAAIRDAIQDYAENHLDDRARGVRLRLDNLELLPANVIAETYPETVSTSFGPMRQLHARLTFDRRASQWVREQVRDALVGQRLWYVGAVLTGALAALALLWAGLKSGTKPGVGVC